MAIVPVRNLDLVVPLANVLRYRGHCINKEITKTYRRTV